MAPQPHPKPQDRAFRNVLYLLSLAWQLKKRRVIAQFAVELCGYASWVFYTVVFLRFLVDSLATGRPLEHILVFLGAAVVFTGLLDLYRNWFRRRYQPLSDNRMAVDLSLRLFAKAGQVDLACYEDPTFYDRFTLAQKEAAERLSRVLAHVAGAAVAGLSAVVVVLSLMTIDPVLPLFIGFSMVGNFVFGNWLQKVLYERDKSSEGSVRRLDYVNRVLYLPEYAKEIRLSRVERILRQHLARGSAGIVETARKYLGRAVGWEVLRNLFTFLIPFNGAFLYGAYLALVQHSITIGDFAVLASSVVSASWMVINLSNALVEVYKSGFYSENLRGFLEFQNKVTVPADAPSPGPLEELRFENVGFAYDGAPGPALTDVNFRISQGEKIAIVGANGAGKTSLIKLLLRLYDPTSGRVLHNGRDLKTLDLTAYRASFATAFQDFQLFDLTLGENVLLRRPETAEDVDRVQQALRAADLADKVARLPRGLDSPLGRESDPEGVVLSGGERQKLALARAFAKDFEIALFDEPSSALDPLAEFRLYGNMMERCRDKTVIFISHRLSSATLADRIYLLDHGRLVEAGSHAELMAAGGHYARLFALQAENYVKDNYQTILEDA